MFHVKHDERAAAVGVPPAVAADVFGDRLPLAIRFAALLADTGVSHGLIGPRETSRLWDRHILNCAVIEDAFPTAARVVDVGSGAGLPGIALAIARPDLDIVLVEPMLRRTCWLEDTVTELGLEHVTVRRGRAQELSGDVTAPYVTARAVARLATLASWCRPLLDAGGRLVAMKGSSAAQELAEDRVELKRLGVRTAEVRSHGTELLETPVLTADLTFGSTAGPRRPRHARV